MSLKENDLFARDKDLEDKSTEMELLREDYDNRLAQLGKDFKDLKA